ncbi:MAG TPA: A/G-specific adenine glycosylase [Phycisphaerae bacterium]|nr:A/G-specific adenine glycosylase [Phycisphaerae bacterium]HOM51688.1 A/G-specific adenine glycosylase [Phycisphaerae bacterium]HON66154.1 A/G-specific adenine glycosylase [Phycisphaerae bacterium]HOQ86285.1 A/G-specific adenine glycosylase [Phycisphaerae bacterium]HPU26621.1 A/G-specific adenine glycosylase [Phycisphaerae bacterium]
MRNEVRRPVIPPDSSSRSRIRRRLLAWYDGHKRDLPWRRRAGDAYAQMLAELMLQQTQVATVIGYYERFIARFPTVADLARADLDEVLALWSGLGYYSRARHLHAAARAIVEHHGGVVPSHVHQLMSLPGIGRYTAGAIASIAYGRRAAVLDGNVVRVLMRLLALEDDPKRPALREQLWSVAEQLLPRSRCGDFNQALMELGATVCRPGIPDCDECPLRADCRGHERGLVDRIPPPARRATVRSVEYVVAAIRHGGRMLFVQRPLTGLWAGLWELPSEPLAAGETAGDGLRRLRERLPPKCRIKDTEAGTATRQLTHRTVLFHVYEGRAASAALPATASYGVSTGPRTGKRSARTGPKSSGSASAGPPARWLRPDELSQIGLSRAGLAVLQLLRWSA